LLLKTGSGLHPFTAGRLGGLRCQGQRTRHRPRVGGVFLTQEGASMGAAMDETSSNAVRVGAGVILTVVLGVIVVIALAVLGSATA